MLQAYFIIIITIVIKQFVRQFDLLLQQLNIVNYVHIFEGPENC